jgi:hypothetical protein
VEAQVVPVAQVLQVLMEAQEYPQQAVLLAQAVHLDLVDQMVLQVLMVHQVNPQLQALVVLLDLLVQQEQMVHQVNPQLQVLQVALDQMVPLD